MVITQNNFIEQINTHPLLSTLKAHFIEEQKSGLWLVGGAIRDLIIQGQLPNDLDIVVSKNNVDPLCHWVSETYDIKIIPLDEAQAIYRLVAPDRTWTLDVSACQGESIEKDLTRRDLTINAMAVDVISGEILDPYNGQKDLEQKMIQHIDDKNFDEDPLRLLRVFRFQSQLGSESTINSKTLEQVSLNKQLIQSPAKERIYQEFFKLLNQSNGATQALKSMISSGVFHACFSNVAPPDETLLDNLDSTYQDWLNEAEFIQSSFNAELSRYGLLVLLVCLSRLVETPSEILPFIKNQKWSKPLSQYVIKALGLFQNTPRLEDEDYCEQLFLGLGVSTWPILAYWQTTQIISSKQAHIAWLYCQATIDLEASLPQLLDGHTISQLTQLPPGPEIGHILIALRKQQRLGKVNSIEEAKTWLSQFQNA